MKLRTLALAFVIALSGCAAGGAATLPAPTAPASTPGVPGSTPAGSPANQPAANASAAVPSAPDPSAAPPNGQDLLFAKMMIAHHAQAVRMSEILLGKGGVPERVAAIAAFIRKDQTREITEMNAWLVAWGQPAGSPDDPKAARQHGSGHGMLTEAQLAALAAGGPTATPRYLEQMIEHHNGAILMARSVLKVGHNLYIRNLAKHIINEQGAENQAMAALIESPAES